MTSSSFNETLRAFEATEANLERLKEVWEKARKLVPSGLSYGRDPEYDQLAREYRDLLAALPMIDGEKPRSELVDLNVLCEMRLAAEEIGDFKSGNRVEDRVDRPGLELDDYLHLFHRTRRRFVRQEVERLLDEGDGIVAQLQNWLASRGSELERHVRVDLAEMRALQSVFTCINSLVGQSYPRPKRWWDLSRHLGFAERGDVDDIVRHDWPNVRTLRDLLDQHDGPIEVEAEDLAAVIDEGPTTGFKGGLRWDSLGDEDFERLLYDLVSSTSGYEGVDWSMNTNAPDRGRDIACYRVIRDALAGVRRERVMIQCKHWQSKSVSVDALSTLAAQSRLWDSPRVEVLVVATSGRFTADAVAWVEKHNSDGVQPRIEIWANSHLEALLGHRPPLISRYGLRIT